MLLFILSRMTFKFLFQNHIKNHSGNELIYNRVQYPHLFFFKILSFNLSELINFECSCNTNNIPDLFLGKWQKSESL